MGRLFTTKQGHEEHEGVNTEFDVLSNQVIGKVIELYRTLSFFDQLVPFLPFVIFVIFVVKSDCLLCFSFFIATDISDDIPVAS